MIRKDQTGRNTAYKLGYYRGFVNLESKGYKNLNIHQRITVRSAYCGISHICECIKEITES